MLTVCCMECWRLQGSIRDLVGTTEAGFLVRTPSCRKERRSMTSVESAEGSFAIRLLAMWKSLKYMQLLVRVCTGTSDVESKLLEGSILAIKGDPKGLDCGPS